MLAAQIELILLITGLATAGAPVLFLAPVTMMKQEQEETEKTEEKSS